MNDSLKMFKDNFTLTHAKLHFYPLSVLWSVTEDQLENLFTKGVNGPQFQKSVDKLDIDNIYVLAFGGMLDVVRNIVYVL